MRLTCAIERVFRPIPKTISAPIALSPAGRGFSLCGFERGVKHAQIERPSTSDLLRTGYVAAFQRAKGAFDRSTDVRGNCGGAPNNRRGRSGFSLDRQGGKPPNLGEHARKSDATRFSDGGSGFANSDLTKSQRQTCAVIECTHARRLVAGA